MARVYLTVGEKNAIRRKHEEQPEWTHEALAAWAVQRLGKRVLRSTVSKILKNEEQDEHVNQAATRKNTARFPEMESELFEWFRVARCNDRVTDVALRNKANELLRQAGDERDPSKRVSLSWVTRFKNRHGISGRHGKPMLPVVADEGVRREFQRLLDEYPPRDVFVMDELSLLLRMDPALPSDRTRICVLLCCNMDVSEKLEPVVVHNEHAFPDLEGFIDESRLGLLLVRSESPQVTPELLIEWQQQLAIKLYGRKVLLVQNGERASQLPNSLENVSTFKLPLFSAVGLCPIRSHIARVFKLSYKYQLLQWRLDQIAIGRANDRLDSLTAAHMMVRAWKFVNPEMARAFSTEANEATSPLQQSIHDLEALMEKLPTTASMTAEQFFEAEIEDEPIEPNNLHVSTSEQPTSRLMTHSEALQASLRLSAYVFAHGMTTSPSLEQIAELSRQRLASTRSTYEQ